MVQHELPLKRMLAGSLSCIPDPSSHRAQGTGRGCSSKAFMSGIAGPLGERSETAPGSIQGLAAQGVLDLI